MLASDWNPLLKMSCSRLLKKKTFEIRVRGFRWVSLKKGRFGFFGRSFMTSLPGQWAEIVAQSLLVF